VREKQDLGIGELERKKKSRGSREKDREGEGGGWVIVKIGDGTGRGGITGRWARRAQTPTLHSVETREDGNREFIGDYFFGGTIRKGEGRRWEMA